MESVEHLIVGGGPAGLRAAQVLAESGREALVAEKRPEIGPKTCAGGLTTKTLALLRALGLPPEAGLGSVGWVAFGGGAPVVLDPELTHVVTIPRRELGWYQAAWARAAGADVRSGCAVRELDLAARTAVVNGRRLRWRRLIGADGSDSAVRRALKLPHARLCFAAEYNVPGVRVEPQPANWAARHLKGVTEGPVHRIEIEKQEPLRVELEAFANAVRNGTPPEVTPDDALAAIAVSEALVRSAGAGLAVELAAT